jgi:hypothetical protein
MRPSTYIETRMPVEAVKSRDAKSRAMIAPNSASGQLATANFKRLIARATPGAKIAVEWSGSWRSPRMKREGSPCCFAKNLAFAAAVAHRAQILRGAIRHHGAMAEILANAHLREGVSRRVPHHRQRPAWHLPLRAVAPIRPFLPRDPRAPCHRAPCRGAVFQGGVSGAVFHMKRPKVPKRSAGRGSP